MADAIETLATLGIGAVGGGLAAVADRAIPQLRIPIPGTTATIEPGVVIGAVVTGIGLAMGAGRGNGGKGISMAGGVLALGGGMLIVEGAELLDEQILPRIPGIPGYAPPAAVPPQALPPVAAPPVAPMYVAGVPSAAAIGRARGFW